MFAGWQVQPGETTVQGVLEESLAIVARQSVRLHGSGRTDTGVHAIGQVAHFDVDSPLDPFRLRRAVNGVLQDCCAGAIVILEAEHATDSFHARYDATRRRYHYAASGQPRAIDRRTRWLMRPEPDWELMNDAATALLGEHHFGSFCITASATMKRVCRVFRAEWIEEERDGDWRFVIDADRFLHGMVRAIVGTLVAIGYGRIPAKRLPEIIEAHDRRAAGASAPAHGLTLVEVVYPDGFGANLLREPR
jgi:tRNA pseudouridine38-40 synthase